MATETLHNETETHGTRALRTLSRLTELDGFEIADGEPDIRGWTVTTRDGLDIGTVDNLIADPELMKVRYIEVKTKHALLGTKNDEHILIPIGAARLNDEEDVVTLNEILATGIHNIPRFGNTPLTTENERMLWAHYYSTGERIDEEGYDNFFGTRRQGREGRNYVMLPVKL